MNLLSALPGAVAQGLVWGIMAIGVYISYKILDFADLTVDGSLCTGAAVCTVLILAGVNPVLAMLAAIVAGFAAGAGRVPTKNSMPFGMSPARWTAFPLSPRAS